MERIENVCDVILFRYALLRTSIQLCVEVDGFGLNDLHALFVRAFAQWKLVANVNCIYTQHAVLCSSHENRDSQLFSTVYLYAF